MNKCSYQRKIIVNSHLKYNGLSNYIKIAQWNIFAQGFVEADNYQYCTPTDLSLENRKILFHKELNYINADIYCFQEADLHTELLNWLNESSETYLGIFGSKQDSACLLYDNNHGPDGCSIIYNEKKFTCLHHYILDLNQIGSHICLFAVFSLYIDQEVRFIVTSVHLKSKKTFAQERVNQCSVMLSKLHTLMIEWNVNSAVVCGDFNASPDEDVIMTMKKSPYAFVDVYTELTNQNQKQIKQHYTTWTFKKVKSATKRIDSTSSPFPQSDIFGGEQEDIIDYIWYTNGMISKSPDGSQDRTTHLTPVSILDVPDKAEIGSLGIPSVNKYPSDHVSLVAEFVISNCAI